MKYLSTKTYEENEIDLATAPIDAVLDCYNSLFAMSDDGGAHPCSKEAQEAKVYAGEMAKVVAARPEIVEYRNQKRTNAHKARMVGVDVMGV